MSRGNARNDDIAWIDHNLIPNNIYGLLKYHWQGGIFRYMGYSSSLNSIKFKNISTKHLHIYPLGGPREIWKRVCLNT